MLTELGRLNMSNRKAREESVDLLRQCAEERARYAVVTEPETPTREEMKTVRYELQVHQIELEMQNLELRRAQDLLAASQARYFDLYDLAPIGYITLNSAFVMLEVNFTFAAMLGLHKERIVARPLSRYIRREDQDSYYHFCNLFRKTGGTEKCELRLLRQDGTELWVRLDAKPSQAVSEQEEYCITVSDISQRVAAADALRECEKNKFSAIIQSTSDGFWIVDDACRIIEVNQTTCDMWGYTRGELLELHIAAIAVETPEETAARADRIRKNGLERFEVGLRRKDGSIFDAEVSVVLVRGGSDQMVSFCRDISARKQTERELAEYRNNLEALVAKRTKDLQQANQELEAFSHSVSHDLRAPLRTIHSCSSKLIQGLGEQLDLARMADMSRVIASAEKMSNLIDSLLKLSQAGHMEATMLQVDLSKLVLESVEECRAIDPARTVDIVIEPGLMAQGDSALLRIFFTNLIGNAWKYTSNLAAAKIEFGSTLIDDSAVFYVRDNGAGFDMEYAGKLFEPFHRLHLESEFAGSGLGLSIMARVIQRHEGKIWAEGVVDQGAVFYFTLGG